MKTLYLSIIAIMAICISYSAFAEQEVTITVTPQYAKYGDDLLIYASLPSYQKPDELRYYIDVFDPAGKRIDSTLWFARQDFNYTMRTEHNVFQIVKGGVYTILVEQANVMERTGEIVKTISFTLTHPPPLMQFKKGVDPHEVQCRKDLQLVIKSSNGIPACVKSETKIKLVDRGWAVSEPELKFEPPDTSSKIGTPPLQIKVVGENQVRRGTTHSIEIQVVRGNIPVEGARVFIDIEDYGEDIIKEFDGYTNSEGYFVLSWEIPQSFDDVETLLAFIDVTDGISSKTELFKFQVYCLPGEKNCKVEGN